CVRSPLLYFDYW
nr:immunoglobulin heavy chain junction region [Mus musculus]NSM05794.1 immunoglobulin heavy chain junction region [Mus musculus]NSM05898.1 immunoglobulin heavy chain junction region [Mus musculus]NSM06405.1 immunoglobulin heavy chain junction region [Mus musculus]NSM06889.1 immunoglobulin heavy chain junction region [Mus musculus]